MRAAIMQPTYLPWCGYFDLIDAVDCFVFLDTVDFAQQRPNWQKENRILSTGGPRWLRLPTQRPAQGRLIRSTTLKHSDWKQSHLDLIAACYGEAPYFEVIFQVLVDFFASDTGGLAETNIGVIEALCRYMQIDTRLIRASDLGETGGEKAMRLVELCSKVGSDSYLSPIGSHAYIDPSLFSGRGIELRYQHFEHPAYYQVSASDGFVSHLSVVDLLFNMGPDAASIIRSGRRTPFCHSDLNSELV